MAGGASGGQRREKCGETDIGWKGMEERGGVGRGGEGEDFFHFFFFFK